MQKTICEVPFDMPGTQYSESGFVLAARFSKDPDRSLIFAGGAGRNELKCFDNDLENMGRFKELVSLTFE